MEQPVKINNLNWSFGDKQILKNINISFEKNKFYSIIGPNGSGKTTLLKNISKALECQKKSVFIEDIDITSLKNRELARKLAVVPQNTNLDFDFSAFDIVLMGRAPYLGRFQTESEEDLKIARRAMEVTNTWELREKDITKLSGGEQQRVVIARAIAQETDIILLDEPIAHLDIHHQVELLDTIKELNVSVTVIAVLHDLSLAAQYSDYLILFKDGEIKAVGTPEEVITKENIKAVYNMEVHIVEDPLTGKPHIIPIVNQFNKQKSPKSIAM